MYTYMYTNLSMNALYIYIVTFLWTNHSHAQYCVIAITSHLDWKFWVQEFICASRNGKSHSWAWSTVDTLKIDNMYLGPSLKGTRHLLRIAVWYILSHNVILACHTLIQRPREHVQTNKTKHVTSTPEPWFRVAPPRLENTTYGPWLFLCNKHIHLEESFTKWLPNALWNVNKERNRLDWGII